MNESSAPPLTAEMLLHLKNRIWFSVVCTLIDNDLHHHSSEKILITVMTCIVVDKSTDNNKPHSTLFTISTSKRMFFFFRSMTNGVTHRLEH